MAFPGLYFNWLQRGNPTATVDRFPELKNKFETSVSGLYCVGDLTGVPLLKLAADSGHTLVEQLGDDERFKREREASNKEEIYDVVIVGAGLSGIAAGIRCDELGLKHLILESSRVFNTVVNFPKGKPIYVTPEGKSGLSSLTFNDGSKETLLDELKAHISTKNLPIVEDEMVKQIVKNADCFSVKSEKKEYKALRVIVAIGKTGNARRLNVKGENLPKVLNRLIDAGEHENQDILVVGGGDSALEAAIALAQNKNRVTLSYRKDGLSRPKEQNLIAFNKLVASKVITPIFNSEVKEITDAQVVISTHRGEHTVPNQAVYALIGTEIPIQFFKRSNIRMDGEKHFDDYVKFAILVLFAAILYFGKSAPVTQIQGGSEFWTVPSKLIDMPWHKMIKGMMAWLSCIGMFGASAYLLIAVAKSPRRYFGGAWQSFKHLFFGAMFVLFLYLYLNYNLGGEKLLGWSTGNWYSAMYTLAIIVFGLRRMHVHKTKYIRRQTWTLIAFQAIPLFILPVMVFPYLGDSGMLPGWVMEHVFPGKSYWRSYGFILAWPLFLYNLAAGQEYVFWLWVSLVQTFIIIPILVHRFGKGAYCGWICSCGALAETLGDEYRTKAPHGPKAKKMENAGQVVLWFAALLSILIILQTWGGISISQIPAIKNIYGLLVDVIFAGVLGVGVYFFLSGRVWCRFFCPLAALMHIYNRFSVYRIFADKKRCISCGICTRVCHMGIDVMSYANKGTPMDDVQCVRCSSCIVECPMDVLSFGRTNQTKNQQ